MTPNVPGWLIYVLGVVSGALVVMAIGPASDAYWETVYYVRRACLIVGAVVLVGGAIFGIGYLVIQAHSS